MEGDREVSKKKLIMTKRVGNYSVSVEEKKRSGAFSGKLGEG